MRPLYKLMWFMKIFSFSNEFASLKEHKKLHGNPNFYNFCAKSLLIFLNRKHGFKRLFEACNHLCTRTIKYGRNTYHLWLLNCKKKRHYTSALFSTILATVIIILANFEVGDSLSYYYLLINGIARNSLHI